LILPTKSSELSITSTVVICTRHRPDLLERCLAAVRSLNPHPNDILVIDNSEGDHETRRVAEKSQARYSIEAVRGLSRARNRGIAECHTDIVVFLDDDVVPEQDWLAHLLAPFADSETGASSGNVITPDSRRTGEPERPRSIDRQNSRWVEIAAFGGLGFGANMAFRKSALPNGRFFDERLGRGAPLEIGEESYAFVWLLSRGYRVVYIPAAVVHHPPLRRIPVDLEARNSFAYLLLLLTEFPAQRINLISFLFRRLRGKPLDWPRDSPEPGDIVSSRWPVLVMAAIKGLILFIRTPRVRALD
jgi:cellulose synthase/poly-beta-1,6-N-acetylglucosamine synthase-like glycosyltransferase